MQQRSRASLFKVATLLRPLLSKDPNVLYVAEATKMYPTGTGSQDPPPSWGLDRINQQNLPLDGHWAWAYSGVGVVAYLIDSGLTPTPDVPATRIRSNINFVPGESRVDDCYGHGTYVASILGGLTHGVARDVTFVNYRVLDCSNSFTSDTTVAAAIDQMTSDHILNHPNELAVANLSLSTFNGASSPIDTAVLNAITAGITVVVSAGNVTTQSPNPDACSVSPARDGSPSNYTPGQNPSGLSAITVGSTTSTDSMAYDSKYGTCVDIFAPGYAVNAMDFIGNDVTVYGTSFASPHVAGVAALHLEMTGFVNSPSTIQAMIKDYGTPNVLSGLGPGSPNLLLFSGVVRHHACCSS
jgi:subtilisin family serine protease